MSLLQVAVPSRGNIRAYRELKAELAALVGEVNGRHGEVDWTPIRYLNRGFSQATLAGFYRLAHVGLVTPLHDGMNLVAKEYVAAQNPFDPGVLVLSSFAGAAKQLDAALMVNPHDIDGMARKSRGSRHERRGAARALAEHGEQAAKSPVQSWFSDFLQTLADVAARAVAARRHCGLRHADRARHCRQRADAACLLSLAAVLPAENVFRFTEWIFSSPACCAACCNARRISSRFSWIEAITGPAGRPSPTSAASESCRLASMVSGTASVAPSA